MPGIEPILWKLKVDVEVSMEFEMGMCGIGMSGTSASKMMLTCDIDRFRKHHNESAECEVRTQADPHIGKKDVGDANAVPEPGKGRVDHFRIARRFDTGLPKMNIRDDPGTKQGPKTIFVDAQVTAPARIECHVDLPGAPPIPPQTFEAANLIQFSFPYDPWAKAPLTGDVDLGPFLKEYLGKAPIPGKVKKVSGKAHYSLEKEKLELEYKALPSTDMTLHPSGVTGKDLTKRESINYGYEDVNAIVDGQRVSGRSHFIHGNNQIRVLLGGKDQSQQFQTVRYMRILHASSFERNCSYSVEVSWHDDNRSGKSSWVDVPGVKTGHAPDEWPEKRQLNEFLVAVKDFPEFGFLYFYAIIDTKPNYYRVIMTPAVPVTVAEWRNIWKSKRPYPISESQKGWIFGNWERVTGG